MKTDTPIMPTLAMINNHLEQIGSDKISDVEDFLKDFEILIPRRSEKPFILSSNLHPDDYRKHADALEAYNKSLAEYKDIDKKAREYNASVNALIEEYIRDSSGLNDIVPEEYRAKTYSVAYDLGHSSGYSEVRNYLYDLVNIFKK